MNYTWTIKRLHQEGRRDLCFREEQTVRMERVDGGYAIVFEPFEEVGYAETVAECLRSFIDDCFWVWDDYAQAPDNDLTADAQALKRVALAMLEEAP